MADFNSWIENLLAGAEAGMDKDLSAQERQTSKDVKKTTRESIGSFLAGSGKNPNADGEGQLSKPNMENTALDAIGKGFGIAQGVLELGQQWSSMATPADMAQYNAHLADMAQQRGQNFYNNSSLLQAYDSQLPKLALKADDLNPTVGQSIMGIGNSALTGAMAGLSTGNPWAALGGLVVGGVGGFLADQQGRTINRSNANIYNYRQNTERGLNQVAMNTGADQVQDEQFGNLYGTRRAMGGFIRTYNNRPVGYRVYHRKCNGGTLVRLKSK